MFRPDPKLDANEYPLSADVVYTGKVRLPWGVIFSIRGPAHAFYRRVIVDNCLSVESGPSIVSFM
jgi:hypothetical protein